MKGRGANVLVNPVNVTCSGSRCVHIEWLFRLSENCVLARSLAREFVWIVSYAIFVQSFVCSRDLVNEEALAHWGAVAPKTNICNGNQIY